VGAGGRSELWCRGRGKRDGETSPLWRKGVAVGRADGSGRCGESRGRGCAGRSRWAGHRLAGASGAGGCGASSRSGVPGSVSGSAGRGPPAVVLHPLSAGRGARWGRGPVGEGPASSVLRTPVRRSVAAPVAGRRCLRGGGRDAVWGRAPSVPPLPPPDTGPPSAARRPWPWHRGPAGTAPPDAPDTVRTLSVRRRAAYRTRGGGRSGGDLREGGAPWDGGPAWGRGGEP
jgi:hypothetical protein